MRFDDVKNSPSILAIVGSSIKFCTDLFVFDPPSSSDYANQMTLKNNLEGSMNWICNVIIVVCG